jgi:hypothetical protein
MRRAAIGPQTIDLPAYFCVTYSETATPRRLGRSQADVFAPFVYRFRTPPFHGGESGSIPLGSANYFNGLAPALPAVSNECPISAYRRGWTWRAVRCSGR